MASVNWTKIRNEYISTNISYRKLAEKHEISFPTLRDRAVREKWGFLRGKQRDKIVTKTSQKIAEKIAVKEADRLTRTLTLSDRLSDKLEHAIEELDIAIVTNKHKVKTVEFTDGKATREVVDETESIQEVKSLINRAGLKQLTGALKDIKEVQMGIIADSQNKPVAEKSDPYDELTIEELRKLANDIESNQGAGKEESCPPLHE